MALGIPVILTDNTAQSTICNSGLVKAISSTLSEPRLYYGDIDGGEHFNCSVDEAANAIRDVYFNYAKYTKYGAAMRQWASAYDYKNLSGTYESLVAPQKVLLSDIDEVTEEHIKTTSKSLYEKYTRLMKKR